MRNPHNWQSGYKDAGGRYFSRTKDGHSFTISRSSNKRWSVVIDGRPAMYATGQAFEPPTTTAAALCRAVDLCDWRNGTARFAMTKLGTIVRKDGQPPTTTLDVHLLNDGCVLIDDQTAAEPDTYAYLSDLIESLDPDFEFRPEEPSIITRHPSLTDADQLAAARAALAGAHCGPAVDLLNFITRGQAAQKAVDELTKEDPKK